MPDDYAERIQHEGECPVCGLPYIESWETDRKEASFSGDRKGASVCVDVNCITRGNDPSYSGTRLFLHTDTVFVVETRWPEHSDEWGRHNDEETNVFTDRERAEERESELSEMYDKMESHIREAEIEEVR